MDMFLNLSKIIRIYIMIIIIIDLFPLADISISTVFKSERRFSLLHKDTFRVTVSFTVYSKYSMYVYKHK